VVTLDEAAFIDFFANWKSGTGRAPSLDYLSIRPCIGTDPLKEIEDQSVKRIWHRCTSWASQQA
jgi:hypothetical protein